METISRNVILDLLPAVIAGEACEESVKLVEQYAEQDESIARLLQAGSLDLHSGMQPVPAPDDLEMKAMKRVRRSIRRQMGFVVMATAAILMIPLLAMHITGEVDWDPFDFMVMGGLLMGAGFAFVLISSLSENRAYRAGVALSVTAVFLLIFVNGAVGIIGSENNPANLLYAGVLLTGLVGSIGSRLKARGMAVTLFSVSVVQLLVPFLAMLIWNPVLNDMSGMMPVIILNLFFTGLFVVSGLLFRRAAEA